MKEYTFQQVKILVLSNYLIIMDDMTGEIIGEWTLFHDEWINVYLSDNSGLYNTRSLQ